MARMLEYDQLGIERAKGRIFKGLEESHVGFLPTFKVRWGSRCGLWWWWWWWNNQAIYQIQ